MTTTTQETFEIQGEHVGFPVEVRYASAAIATYLVDVSRAQALVGYSGLEVARPTPNRAAVTLVFVKYVDSDLGPYNEVGVSVVVRPHDAAPDASDRARQLEYWRGRVGAFIHRLPVNQAFTCEAGRTIWGFPKFMTDSHAVFGPRRASVSIREGDHHILDMEMPYRRGRFSSNKAGVDTYSYVDGILRRTPWTIGVEGVSLHRPSRVRLSLGDHEIAGELRELGLPKNPLFAATVRHMSGAFEPPVLVR